MTQKFHSGEKPLSDRTMPSLHQTATVTANRNDLTLSSSHTLRDRAAYPMNTQALSTTETHSTSAVYLRQMDELRDEIQSAMLAIAGNSLSVLEGSLWRQEVLCTSLKHLSRTLGPDALHGPLTARIHETSIALQELNRTYSLLIQQSSQSADLLYRLCRSYKDHSSSNPSALRPSATAQTWSCEA